MTIKKIALLILLATLCSASFTQTVEYYSNPQRYLFTQYDTYSHRLPGALTSWNEYNPLTTIFTRAYIPNPQATVYGVAIPIHCFDSTQHPNLVRTREWDNMMNFFDTSGCGVYIATRSGRYDEAMNILARSNIKRGENVIEGIYFMMPEKDTFVNNIHPPKYNVVEVYFSQPIQVSDTFFIGSNVPPMKVSNGSMFQLCTGRMLTRDVTTTQLPFGFYKIFNDNYLIPSDHTNGDLVQISEPSTNHWGGPFPIIAPPPCVEPLRLTVTEQHKQGATIAWDAQYANTLFELEYGPQGFAPGSGTTVGNIYPDAQHHCSQTISGLPMDADITARVRAFCQIAGGFSDWQSVDFHSQLYYTVSTSVNNDYWGWVKGGGDYIADTTVRLYAYPKSSLCPFVNWSDGTNQNPRVVTVTRDTSFRAIFRCDSSDVTGIHGFDASGASFTLHPNPAHSEVSLLCSLPIGDWRISDIQGRTVLSGHTTKPSTTIDISSLRHGIYLVSIKTQDAVATRKLVKQ